MCLWLRISDLFRGNYDLSRTVSEVNGDSGRKTKTKISLNFAGVSTSKHPLNTALLWGRHKVTNKVSPIACTGYWSAEIQTKELRPNARRMTFHDIGLQHVGHIERIFGINMLTLRSRLKPALNLLRCVSKKTQYTSLAESSFAWTSKYNVIISRICFRRKKPIVRKTLVGHSPEYISERPLPTYPDDPPSERQTVAISSCHGPIGSSETAFCIAAPRAWNRLPNADTLLYL